MPRGRPKKLQVEGMTATAGTKLQTEINDKISQAIPEINSCVDSVFTQDTHKEETTSKGVFSISRKFLAGTTIKSPTGDKYRISEDGSLKLIRYGA